MTLLSSIILKRGNRGMVRTRSIGKRLWYGVFIAVMMASSAFAEGDENIIFTVDVSGSMAGMLDGIGRSISEQVDSLESAGSGLALVKFEGCGADKVYYPVPLGLNNASAMKDEARKLVPLGGTDIVASLNFNKLIISKLLEETGQCARVILFTDNMDTCGNGNRHFEVLKELQRMCFGEARKFSIDIVTSSVEETVVRFLDEISNYTGGETYHGSTIDEISDQVKTIVKKYRERKVAAPLTSKRTSDTTKSGGGKTPTPSKAQQTQKQKATQGKKDKKEKKAGES